MNIGCILLFFSFDSGLQAVVVVIVVVVAGVIIATVVIVAIDFSQERH